MLRASTRNRTPASQPMLVVASSAERIRVVRVNAARGVKRAAAVVVVDAPAVKRARGSTIAADRAYWSKLTDLQLQSWAEDQGVVLPVDEQDRADGVWPTKDELIAVLVARPAARPSSAAALQRAVSKQYPNGRDVDHSTEGDVDDDEDDGGEDVDDKADNPVVDTSVTTKRVIRKSKAVVGDGDSRCGTCLQLAPLGARDALGRWICACGMRGDVVNDNPNAHLSACTVAAIKQSASSVSVSTAQGQTTPTPALTALDRQFNAVTALGVIASFVPSSVPLTQAAINADIRRSLHAPRHPPAAASLVALIQSGRLEHPGYALPRTVQSVQDDATQQAGVISIVNTQLSSTAKYTPPPELKSPTDLLSALVSTIGPALLVHNPAALLQWFTLIRTVLAVNSTISWDAAREYMHMTLAERIIAGESFSPLFHDAYTSVQSLFVGKQKSAGAGQQSSDTKQTKQQQAKDQSAPEKPLSPTKILCNSQGICSDFNFAAAQCVNAACKLKHVCPYAAASGCSATDSHRGVTCANRPVRSTSFKPRPTGRV